MKKFIVEQLGYVQLEANRTFIVEVPDDMTEEDAEELVKDQTLPEDESMAWKDDLGHKWIGYDVEIWETDVYESDGIGGLKVINLDELDKNGQKGVRA